MATKSSVDLESKEIAMLENLRKVTGRPPIERKVKKSKKVIGEPVEVGEPSRAIKRAASQIENETPKRNLQGLQFTKPSDERFLIDAIPLTDLIENEKMPVAKPEPIKKEDVKPKIISVKKEEKNSESTQKTIIMKTQKAEESKTTMIVADEPALNAEKTVQNNNKKRPLTYNNEWCPFGVSQLLYDFERGAALSDATVEKNMKKLAKNNHPISWKAWLDKAATFHGNDATNEELCVAFGFITLKLNEKSKGTATSKPVINPKAYFNLEAAKSVDCIIQLPSKIRFSITSLISDEVLQLIAIKDTDFIARKLSILIITWIGENDPCTPGYTAPIGKSKKYFSLGSTIQSQLAVVMSAGLGWDTEKSREERCRIMSISRSIMENYLGKTRCNYDRVNQPGASHLIARDLRNEFGTFQSRETENSDDNDDESDEHEMGENEVLEQDLESQ